MSTTTPQKAGPDGEVDAITFEVVRNRLSAITEEQAITLKNVSGSPVVTDATDFNVGTYLADGQIVTMGPQVLFHSGSMASVVRNVVADCADEPGIREGDMFILNNPYKGALHQQDVSIVAPVFVDGERVAWVGSCAHQIDMGGMNFGSWGVGASTVHQEAVLTSGVRIVEGGEIRTDIWDMVLGMTRMPLAVGLDFKAMIAANNVASRRLRELFDRYGLERVQRIMALEIDHSEQQLRERLRELPDGVFRGRDHLEHDGHTNALYDVCVEVRKTGDRLVFDFAGTSPQAPGFINCTWSGTLAGVFTALLPTLAPALRWNEGLLRVIELEVPEGSVCNATFPAPVSAATISATWVVTNVVLQALSRLAATSPQTIGDAAAVTKGSMSAFVINGTNRDGTPYGNFLLDSTAGGGGAYVDHDGLDGSGGLLRAASGDHERRIARGRRSHPLPLPRVRGRHRRTGSSARRCHDRSRDHAARGRRAAGDDRGSRRRGAQQRRGVRRPRGLLQPEREAARRRRVPDRPCRRDRGSRCVAGGHRGLRCEAGILPHRER